MSDVTDLHANAARGGDSQGFSDLYDRLSPSLFAWASFRLHGPIRKMIDPEDLVQEVWWRALDAFHRFDPEKGSFRTWVFSIATNVYRESLRRRPASPTDDEEDRKKRIASLPPELHAQLTSITTELSRRESVTGLIEAISKLDREQQKVMIHCGLEGLSAVAAAPLIGVPVETVRKRWQRLRAMLESNPGWANLFGA